MELAIYLLLACIGLIATALTNNFISQKEMDEYDASRRSIMERQLEREREEYLANPLSTFVNITGDYPNETESPQKAREEALST